MRVELKRVPVVRLEARERVFHHTRGVAHVRRVPHLPVRETRFGECTQILCNGSYRSRSEVVVARRSNNHVAGEPRAISRGMANVLQAVSLDDAPGFSVVQPRFPQPVEGGF